LLIFSYLASFVTAWGLGHFPVMITYLTGDINILDDVDIFSGRFILLPHRCIAFEFCIKLTLPGCKLDYQDFTKHCAVYGFYLLQPLFFCQVF